MKALITGGAGFVGFHLAKHLSRQGHTVVIADNFQRGKKDGELQQLLKQKNVKLATVDVTKEEDFSKLGDGYDWVFHFAAINGTGNFYRIPDKVLKVGAVGTINILEWFAEKNSKGKLMLASSSEAYAGMVKLLGRKFPIPTPEGVPLVIEDPSNARWSYAASKILGEVAMFSYAKARNLGRFAVIRYHNIYGPRMGNEHVIPQFIQRIIDREDPFTIHGGKPTRAFCYVDDAVRATQLVMERDETNGQIVHIGRSDQEIRISELAKELFKVTGFSPKVRLEEAPAGSAARRCPDVSKLAKLGFRPEVPLTEGLKRTYKWYRDNQ